MIRSHAHLGRELTPGGDAARSKVRAILVISGITPIVLLFMAERLWRHRQQQGYLGRVLVLRDGVTSGSKPDARPETT
ncbi:MAG: hypothetical protein ACYDDA_07880 [Acidiferrobacteraceae bacterium]